MSTSQSSDVNANVETVKAFYAALNRNDIPAILKLIDPQIERIEFEGLPSEGNYRGYAEFKEHVSKARETWAEGGCEPERLVSLGDKVIAFVYVRVRLKNKSEWNEGRVADVFTLQNNKITQMRTFAETQQALDWLGIKETDI